ncbi:Cadherin-like beta sandwich domain-containing protein [Paenibacillus sp. UNCCL117]|uniref:S-layer homology domain-containing protein n=1 Tax=unclassified Paenibacillus TaxID=185978 RepID=UPI000881A479|nr:MULTISPECIES: S-layer homology domain-containing protein [unclassified Paenibacillus]SDD51224.1 Cadherin-like beta sandwich domain-containing protein [Paenibacillus sp. cl123]SFW49565.1 Cadherin-like beta sandwich domain-containing protein [Paenibacillus sp. UNCCL117]
MSKTNTVSYLHVLVIAALIFSNWMFPINRAVAEEVWTPVRTAAELSNIRSNLSGNYRLMQDIDLASYDFGDGDGWKPIANFTGKLDGNGFSIRNMRIDRPNDNEVGLFKNTDRATIINMHLTNIDIKGSTYVGGIAGMMVSSLLQTSSAEGTVTGVGKAGVLVGYNASTNIYDSYAKGQLVIASSSSDSFGGLVGYSTGNSSGVIVRSYAAAAVANGSYSGGLIGQKLGGASITSSYWDTKTSGQAGSSGGTGKTMAELMVKTTFAGWDFTGTESAEPVWGMVQKSTYPLHYADYKRVALASLSVKDGDDAEQSLDREFASDYGAYSVRVGYKTDRIVVSGNPLSPSSTVSVDGGGVSKTLMLIPGQNDFNIEVNDPADPARLKAIYKLSVYREDGTAQYPHRITTADQLSQIGNMAEGYAPNHEYKLEADLDLSGFSAGAGWKPIGSAAVPFQGVFDGNNHTIAHLKIDRPGDDYVGLFGSTLGANLANVALLDVAISGKSRVGGLIGYADATSVSGISVQGAVSGSGYTGGLIGAAEPGTHVNESYSAAVVAAPAGYTGGLIADGPADGSVTHSFWDSEKSGQSSSAGGGTPKTTVEMMQKATYIGYPSSVWEFGSGKRWGIIEGTTYPMPYDSYAAVSPLGLSITAPGTVVTVSPAAFDPAKGIYTVTLTAPVPQANITVAPAAGQTITINNVPGTTGNIGLGLGEQTVEVIVKGATGATGLYRVTVNVPSPTVQSVQVPLGGVYGIGDELDFVAAYDFPVEVDSAQPPVWPIGLSGSPAAAAIYNGKLGGDAKMLSFRYTVQEGDLSSSGIVPGASLTVPAASSIIANGEAVSPNLPAPLPDTSGIVIDGVKPNIVLTPETTSPTNGAVNVSVHADGTGTGLASLKWAAGIRDASYFGSAGTEVTASVFTAIDNGTYTVYAADTAGNEQVETITIANIVTTKPTIVLDYSPKTPVRTGVDVTVTASVYDDGAGNGLKVLKWAAGERTAADFSSPTFGTDVSPGGTFHVAANGTYTVYAADTAGNEQLQTITITNILTTKPTITLDYSPKTPVRTGVDVTVTASVYDHGAGNGLKVLKWAAGERTAADFSSPTFGTDVAAGGTFHVAENGTYTVYAVDTAGNEQLQTITIANIVTTKPTITLDYSPKTPVRTGVDVMVMASVYGQETGNELKVLKWAAGERTAADFASPTFGTDVAAGGTFHVAANGTYTVYAADTVGNEQLQTITIANNVTAKPTITLDYSPRTPVRTGVDVTVTASVYDDGAGNGLKVLKWAAGERTAADFSSPAFGTDVASGGTFHVADNGTYTVYAADTAGNEQLQTVAIANIVTGGPRISLDYEPKERYQTGVSITVLASPDRDAAGNQIETLRWVAGSLNVEDFRVAAVGADVPASGAFRVTTNGFYTIYAADTAGNEQVKTIEITNIGSYPDDSPSSSGTDTGGPQNIPGQFYLLPGNDYTLEIKGVKLFVPAGAIKQATTITVKQLTDEAVGLLGSGQPRLGGVYELTKDVAGAFQIPVRLSLTLPADERNGDRQPVLAYYDETAKKWVALGGTVKGGVLTGETDHFTKFAAIAAAKEPDSAPILTDIDRHWAEQAIRKGVADGLVDGYPNGIFRPDAAVSRAEFTLMLHRALRWQNDQDLRFQDQSDIPDWAKEAVAAAVQAGVIAGYPDDTFRPAAPINRAEATVMIAKAAGLPASALMTTFADDEAIGGWASPYIEAARKAGLVQGQEGNRFEPQASTTRAEAVVLLQRLLSK